MTLQKALPVKKPDLHNSRQQNMVIIGQIAGKNLIPGIETRHFLAAMEDIMDGKML